MFNDARLKLTAWYLLIIMFISMAFSVVIYRVQTAELERFVRTQRMRIERGLYGLPPNAGPIVIIDPQLIEEAERRLGVFLIILNGVILVAAGGSGYLLAGRTLKPIQEMMEEQSRFIGDASHELRTPLTSLKSAMEVNLRDKSLTIRGARELLTESLNEVNKLQSLSEGLLQLVRYPKQASRNLKRVSLAAVMGGAVRKIEPLASQKKVILDDEVAVGEVEGNTVELEELAVILLDNAVKYSHEGGKVTAKATGVDGGFNLVVIDRGIGISRKDLPHIFDRFYRADSARQRSGVGGYGLGLAIAKKIVAAHHGTIEVQSRLNRGTTFTVFLPSKQRNFSQS